MASGMHLKCKKCDFTIEVWSDGNPYFIDDSGQKKYAYHPQSEADLCTEVDVPHICQKCAHQFNVDSAATISHCPKCDYDKIIETWYLLGESCPACKEAKIVADGFMIS